MKGWSVLAVCALSVAVPACTGGGEDMPVCSDPEGQVFVLEAQSVPSATQLLCVAELPPGWQFGGSLIKDTETTLWLDNDRAGIHALQATMSATCDISSAVEVPPAADEVGMRVYQEPKSLDPGYSGSRYLVFEGGCITHEYSFADDSDPTLVIEADLAISTLPRHDIIAQVQDSLGLTLCGAEAPPCVG
jgi:hypothetical protein